MFELYKKELDLLRQNSMFRVLKPAEKLGKYICLKGKKHLNLSSNDYLGVAGDKKIAQDFLSQYQGTLGSTSSRLLTGNDKIYEELETVLANLFQKERALIFNSGYHANVGIVSALANKKTVVFCDRFNHASMIDGLKLSGCRFFRYQHSDYGHLETLLRKHRNDFDNAIILTESVFSMDGDIADIKKLVGLKKSYKAMLIVDEAHGFGVFGEKGLGICEKEGCIQDVDLIVGVFGKSVGSMGAFCVANDVLIDYLINKARPLIFSTALPEINIAFSKYVVEKIFPSMLKKRQHLLSLADTFRDKLIEKGLQTFGSSHIIPIILGENEKTVDVCEKLQQSGYFLLPIRHPTVPIDTARIRVSLRADLTLDEIIKIPDLIG